MYLDGYIKFPYCRKIITRSSWSIGVFLAFMAFFQEDRCFASTEGGWAAKPHWTEVEESKSIRKQEILSSREVSPFSPGSHNVALDVGQVFLMGDLTKNYNDTIGLRGHYTYGVSELFSFDSSLGYSEHSDSKYSMFNLLAGLRTNLSWYDKVIPYGIFGLGFYKPSYRDTSAGPGTNNSVSALLFGIHLGPGIDLELSKNFFFGASLTFHKMFSAEKPLADGTPFTLGGSLVTFLIHFGVTF